MYSQAVKSVEGGVERGFDVAKLTWGRKCHILVDTLGLLLAVIVTSAGVQNSDGARLLFTAIREDARRSWLHNLPGRTLEIVEKLPGQKGFQALPGCRVVERTLAWKPQPTTGSGLRAPSWAL